MTREHTIHILFLYSRELDPGLEEPIATIIWATPRLLAEVQELKVVSDQLTAKYGKEFAQSCKSNQLNNVNEKLMHKLSVQAPPRVLVEKYLEEIAKAYNIPYIADPSIADEDVLAAEGLLIDFNGKKNSGGGGGMRMMSPELAQPPNPNLGFAYPPPGGAPQPYPPAQVRTVIQCYRCIKAIC